MSVGFVMLCHEALHRAAEVAGHWAGHGCPVVIHVDARVPQAQYDALATALKEHDNIRFCGRWRCEWGTWSLVAASQTAAEVMLREFPQVGHVYLASGSCLPLRPTPDLIDYLAARPDTSFIESVTTEDVPWTVGGLDAERFTLRFPFSWRRHRRLFDRYVELQRRLGVRRRIPEGLTPHMGSQWWCLSRATLERILTDPRRAEFDRYFAKVWIPDESYYQTLVRRHPGRVESRSLTLSKFDFQGKPHVFYDDHLQLLRRSDCFVARKIWPRADRLYEMFLAPDPGARRGVEPNPGKIDRVFARAVERRTRGRAGLYMPGRFPNPGWENGKTCAPYAVFEGFGDLFEGFPAWLHRATGMRAHGHLFAPRRAEFADNQRAFAGALDDGAELRDHNPEAFLTNLVWNTRGERQGLLFGPRDVQRIGWFFAEDANAQVWVVSGAWAVTLFRSKRPFAQVRKAAARLQRIEAAHLDLLRRGQTKARVRIWSMADLVDAPMEPLQTVIDEVGPKNARRLTEAPNMVDLTGFGQFLQNLRNEGMQPHLMGDFPVSPDSAPVAQDRRKRYFAR
ncbi:glycosyl transferase [Mesobaculum littorinae]|uniref:Peptide O-xylosyltransferase n=1 Tax=Mesobaculum littorinae TaxID=2486419 RepID=A0A438AGM6_9RHOB|nr:beta-1,6-N-acetylglucosaminyltransferase [Mesobaculum littorinae]RVV97861.1 glycosyl transferase [Mesobaculum littorinae]